MKGTQPRVHEGINVDAEIALFSRTAYARLCSRQSVLPTWEQVSCRDAAWVRRNWLLRRRIIRISVASPALWGDEPAGQRSVKRNKRLCFPLRRLRKVASHLLPGSMFWNMSSLWQDLSQGDGRLETKRHRKKREIKASGGRLTRATPIRLPPKKQSSNDPLPSLEKCLRVTQSPVFHTCSARARATYMHRVNVACVMTHHTWGGH